MTKKKTKTFKIKLFVNCADIIVESKSLKCTMAIGFSDYKFCVFTQQKLEEFL